MEYQSFDRYEYKFISIPNYKPEISFNKLGEEGWEFITIFNNKGIFKRKLTCIITE